LCIDNKHKENQMRFNLYRCEIRQASRTTTCHLVAASEEHAAIIIDQHCDALNLKRVLYSLERVDHTLSEDQRLGLDEVLENAPAGIVSFTSIGWIAHAAPVHKLRLFASLDYSDIPIYVVAPHAGVAMLLMQSTQLPNSKRVHRFKIRDITDTLPDDKRKNLEEVLAAGQAGIAECDDEHGGWWVW
jgi:hypothetical protein